MAWSMTEFSSKQLSILPIEKNKFDENRLIKNLSDAITYETISDEESADVDAITYLAFHKFLRIRDFTARIIKYLFSIFHFLEI